LGDDFNSLYNDIGKSSPILLRLPYYFCRHGDIRLGISIEGVSGVKKLGSLVAVLAVLGMFYFALPRLSPANLHTGEGLFSLAWLVLAGCVLIGHGLELRKIRGRKKKMAIVSLRPPKTLGHTPNRERQRDLR